MIFCFNLYCKILYFASLAYIVESSGGPEVLCISDVLASGSVRGFLAGKHFNRCKRLHPLFATTLEILHFPGFIEKYGWMTDDIMALLHELGGNVLHGVIVDYPTNGCLHKVVRKI